MKQYRHILLLATAILATACSSDTTLEEQQTVDTRQPMVFAASATAANDVPTATGAPAMTGVTRADAGYLETTFNSFKVGTWKAFATSQQQTVMGGYRVNHTTDHHWNYVDVDGQLQRYWDLAAFPYEFRAVAPYTSGATITPDGLTVSASFRAQVLTNGVYNVSATVSEPCVVAQVSRSAESAGSYKDTDEIKQREINDAAKGDATRDVRMPFHHLVSKVGFRIYIDNPQPIDHEWDDGIGGDEYTVWIKQIQITVKRDGQDFITASNTYTATNAQGLLNGTFTDNTTQSAEHTIMSHNAYTLENQNNLHKHLNQADAFDMTPDCIIQLPQDNVKVHVQLTIHTNHVLATEQEFTYDTWLSLDKNNTAGDHFTWLPDTRYIYYLHIPNLHGHEINLTSCEILPWDDVQTSDIDVGL
jgi:hypothetical protein